jgi:PAT family beta-lactamase induction signal transducer AmpG
MACCVGVGMIATLLSKEPTIQGQLQYQEKSKRILYPYHHLGTISEENYPDLADSRLNKPFWAEFYQKLQASLKGMLHRSDLRTILCFIFFYKIGDTVLNTMTMPFLLEMGFSKLEIAHVAKSFGIGAMIFGGFIGGAYMVHGSLAWTLVITAVLQMVASLMFWMQAFVGHHIGMLFVTIGIENFAVGLGNAAFIVYLSSRCRMPHTATHFALLTSFGSFCRVMLSSIAGWTADHLTWPDFYSLTAVLCAPALLLTIFKTSCFEYEEKVTDPLSADKPLKITP